MILAVADVILRHQVYLEGLKDNRFPEFVVMAQKLTTDIKREFADLSYDNFGSLTKVQLQKFIAKLKGVIREHFSGWLKDLLDFLVAFTRVDRKVLVDAYQATDPEFEEKEDDKDWFPIFWKLPIAGVGMLPDKFLVNFVSSGPVMLERWANIGWANNTKSDEVMRSIVGTKAANFKDGIINKFAQQSQAATDTVIQHLATQTNFRLAKQLSGEYQWLSVLDNHTTKICRSRAFLIYVFGLGPLPPAHVRCRSSIAPYFRNGKPAPANYGVWADELPSAVRSDMFKDDPGSEFKGTKPLTLAQFQQKSKFITMEAN